MKVCLELTFKDGNKGDFIIKELLDLRVEVKGFCKHLLNIPGKPIVKITGKVVKA